MGLTPKAYVGIPKPVRPILELVGDTAGNYGLHAYAVGGCVRDWLLGRDAMMDLDVTVEGDALEFAQQTARTLGADCIIHPQFKTATLTMDSMRIDFASCRHETYSRPGDYPRVSPGALKDDLFRRDFTINAMAVDLEPENWARLIDPFGGREDLKRKRLRILHAKSFQDDPSRILRGVRFLHRFNMKWERSTERGLKKAIADNALSLLNAGRLHKELERMLKEPNARKCLEDFARLLGESR